MDGFAVITGDFFVTLMSSSKTNYNTWNKTIVPESLSCMISGVKIFRIVSELMRYPISYILPKIYHATSDCSHPSDELKGWVRKIVLWHIIGIQVFVPSYLLEQIFMMDEHHSKTNCLQ